MADSGNPAGAEDDPYVISDERLAEIRALLIPGRDCFAPRARASSRELAAAIYDLLAERDDRG